MILVPFIGVFAYLIARGAHLAGEQVETAIPPTMRLPAFMSVSKRGKRSADELAKLAELHDRGVITDAEFQQGKAQALS